MASLEDDKNEIIDPMKMLFLDDEEDDRRETLSTVPNGLSEPQAEEHHIRSVESTVLIRQLPSRGLSFQLWPAATALVTLLDVLRRDPSKSPLTSTLFNGRDRSTCLKILELGSGTGLVGIAAAATLAADVTLTDLQHVVPNLEFNAEANAAMVQSRGGRVHVTALEWGNGDDVARLGNDFDVVLASDVVYHDHLYDPLIETLRFVLKRGGGVGGVGRRTVFVMAHLRRWKKEAVFFRKAKRLFEVEVLHVDDVPPPGSRTAVTVYAFAVKTKNLSSGMKCNCK